MEKMNELKKELEEAIESAKTAGDIDLLLVAVTKLKELQTQTKNSTDEAKKEKEESTERRTNLTNMFIDYGSALVEDCEFNGNKTAGYQEETRKNDEKSKLMIKMMSPMASNVQRTEKGKAL